MPGLMTGRVALRNGIRKTASGDYQFGCQEQAVNDITKGCLTLYVSELYLFRFTLCTRLRRRKRRGGGQGGGSRQG